VTLCKWCLCFLESLYPWANNFLWNHCVTQSHRSNGYIN